MPYVADMASDDGRPEGEPPEGPRVPRTWRGYDADETPDPEPEPGQRPALPMAAPKAKAKTKAQRANGSKPAGSAGPSSQKVLLAVGLAVALGVGGLAVAILVASGGDVSDPLQGVVPPDMHSQEGLDELAEDLREETGSSLVFDVNLYPDYAVVNVPAKPGTPRADGYYWNGSLDDWAKGKSDEEPFDLTELDGDLLDGMCADAKGLVEDPDTCYILVSRPDPGAGEGWFSAYTSNDYSEGGYIVFDLEGQEVDRVTW